MWTLRRTSGRTWRRQVSEQAPDTLVEMVATSRPGAATGRTLLTRASIRLTSTCA